MWRDISLPADGEEEEEEVVLVVVRVHVDSSGWIGWGKGPCFLLLSSVFFFGGGRNEERGGRLLGQRDGEFVI